MSFMEEYEHRDFIRNYKKFQEQFDKLYWKKVPNWYLAFKEDDSEEFKPIDEYQGFYFISNYGKVISFKRKLPGVRQASMLNGFWVITLNHFKSTKLHYIHDLVYTYFVGPIKPQHRVIHKDNNTSNNYYKNLQLISISEMLGKKEPDLPQDIPAPLLTSDQTRKRKEAPKKRGRPQKASESRGKRKKKGELDFGILQFNLEGKFVREFSSLGEAAKDQRLDSEFILDCLKGKSKTAGNYQWRYSADPNFDDGIYEVGPVSKPQTPPPVKQVKPAKSGKLQSNSHRALPICQYDREGNFIREFLSITEAAASIGLTPAAVSFAMNNRNRTAGGFTWKRKD